MPSNPDPHPICVPPVYAQHQRTRDPSTAHTHRFLRTAHRTTDKTTTELDDHAYTVITEPHTESRLPARPDDTPLPQLVVYGGRITGADTAAELVAQLVPGYADLTDDEPGHDEALWRR
jgi:hypothetical protein